MNISRPTRQWKKRLSLCLCALAPLACFGQGTVVAWGDPSYGKIDVPPGLTNVVAVAAGDSFSLALRSDGTIVGWGNSWHLDMPWWLLTNVVAINSDYAHSLALRGDGSVVPWGLIVPPIPSGLTNVIAIACGETHDGAVLSDGRAVAWGDNQSGQTNLPVTLRDASAISAGYYQTMVVRTNGLINGVGLNAVVGGTGLGEIVSAGYSHNLALHSDGFVNAWGYNWEGELDVPAGLSNVVDVSAGQFTSYALKSDGTVVAWGRYLSSTNLSPPIYYPAFVPTGLSNVIALVAGSDNHVLAIVGESLLVQTLDRPNLDWVTSGTARWFSQKEVVHVGSYAARSGIIGDRQFSRIQTRVQGPCDIQFWWKVSSETNADVLSVSVKSATNYFNSISGEVDWRLQTFSLPPGAHVVKWDYRKNASGRAGSDRGWLDGFTVETAYSKMMELNVPTNVIERDGVLTNQAFAKIFLPLPFDIQVALSSSDPTEITVPPFVTIPAGSTNAAFNIAVLDDTDVDGPQTVTITATATNYFSEVRSIIVEDREPAELLSPSPANLATNVPRTNDLIWHGANGSEGPQVTNDVYFGTNAIPGAAELIGTTTTKGWNLPDLAPSTTYYWQIVARNRYETIGPVWSFTTSSKRFPTDPIPALPANPSPAHLGTNVARTADLAWAPGSVVGETFTNHIYFGTNSVLTVAEFVGSTTSSNWNLPFLDPLTTYYWRVVAQKGSEQATGAVWQFTTEPQVVDHYEWSGMPSSFVVGTELLATIVAIDKYGLTATGFAGIVSIEAAVFGGSGLKILADYPNPLVINAACLRTAGYSFTPNAKLLLTHLRSYSGTKVTLWTDTGTRLIEQPIAVPHSSWIEIPVPTPRVLFPGSRYRLTFCSSNLAFGTGMPASFSHGTIDQSFTVSCGDAFPTTPNSFRWFFADARLLGSTGTVPITTNQSVTFTQGLWSGHLQLASPASKAAFIASDSDGRYGASEPFEAWLRVPLAAPEIRNGEFMFGFSTTTQQVYVIEYKDALTDAQWIEAATINGDGLWRSITNSTSIPQQRFFRAKRF